MKNPLLLFGWPGLSPARRTLLAGGLLFALTLIAYSNSFNSEFQLDDLHQVEMNVHIRDIRNIPAFFVDAGNESSKEDKKGYRPVTLSSLALSHAISGYNVRGYHMFNFLLHLLNVVLVYAAVKAVLQEKGKGKNSLAPLVAALVFALHPIQTGAVTYVSGRAVLLAVFFYLAAFYAFLRFRTGSGARAVAWGAASPIMFLAALLSKEMAVSLIAVFIAYDFIFTIPARVRSAGHKRIWIYYLPFVATLSLYLAVKLALQGSFAEAEAPYGVMEYLVSESKVFLLYIRLLFLPINQNAFYDLPTTGYPDMVAVSSAALVIAAVYLLYRQRHNQPAASFFGAWFLITIAPESSLIPISDTAVEYRLYLPSIGIITAAVLIAMAAIRGPQARKSAAVGIIALLMALTFQRNTVWADDYSFWRDVVKKSPHSPRAHARLGVALLNQKRYFECLTELQRFVAINPYIMESHTVYNNMGICLYQLGTYDQAAEMFETAVKINPGFGEGYGNLGGAFMKMGRYKDAEFALKKALAVEPGYMRAYITLAMCYNGQGRYQEAVSELKEAVRIAPDALQKEEAESLLEELKGQTTGGRG